MRGDGGAAEWSRARLATDSRGWLIGCTVRGATPPIVLICRAVVTLCSGGLVTEREIFGVEVGGERFVFESVIDAGEFVGHFGEVLIHVVFEFFESFL